MDEKTKTLLYFESKQEQRQRFAGTTIQHYHFKEIKSNRSMILKECHFDVALSWIMNQKYYQNIRDAQNDFDLLWKCENNEILPIDDSFQTVANKYQSLAKDGFSEAEINSMILKQYHAKNKCKKLK